MHTTWLQDQFVILLLTAIFFALSGGWMLFVGGGTQRIRRLLVCSTLFIFLTGEAMMVHSALTALTGFQNAWIALAILGFCTAFAVYIFLKKRAEENFNTDESQNQ